MEEFKLDKSSKDEFTIPKESIPKAEFDPFGYGLSQDHLDYNVALRNKPVLGGHYYPSPAPLTRVSG